MSSFARRFPVSVGLALIFVCTWAIDMTLGAQAQGWIPHLLPEWLGIIVGWGFVLAAVIFAALTGGGGAVRALFRRYLIWRVNWRWYAVVLLWPAAAVMLALGVEAALTGISPMWSLPFVRNFVPAGLSLWVVAVGWMLFEIVTNGEEIGWRGIILPRMLERTNALAASLVLGVIWWLWHLPKIFAAGPAGEAHSYPFWVMAFSIVSFSVLITWVFEHTRGSLLLATLFHAASNTAFMVLPIAAGSRAFYISIGLQVIVAIVVAVVEGPTLKGRSERDEAARRGAELSMGNA